MNSTSILCGPTDVTLAWLVTALGSDVAISTERGDDTKLVMSERGCQAIEDPGSLDLVRGL